MALFPLGILSAAGAGGVQGDYELIESAILVSNQSSVTFSNLGNYASTYKHLQIRYASRGTTAANSVSNRMHMNNIGGASGTSYALHGLGGSTNVFSYGFANERSLLCGLSAGANQATNVFGSGVVDILDYSSSTKNTTVRALSGVSSGVNTSSEVVINGGLFNNTAAVTEITITPDSGNLVAGSRFSLYGIRG
jgi:hypothetical protein